LGALDLVGHCTEIQAEVEIGSGGIDLERNVLKILRQREV
jgi:hypothetical protein